MSENAVQFSSEQILTAAERAEADGRLDFAVHFYTHIVEWFPDSDPAVAAAQRGLERLAPDEAARALPPSETPAWQVETPAHGISERDPSGPVTWNPGFTDDDDEPTRSLAHRLAHSGTAAPVEESAPTAARRRMRIGPAPESYRAPDAKDLPTRRTRYWLGRTIASMMTGLGLLVLIATVVAVIAAVAVPDQVFGISETLAVPVDPMVAISAALTGGVLIVVGQALSALFALSNAAIDLAVVQRVTAEREQQRL